MSEQEAGGVYMVVSARGVRVIEAIEEVVAAKGANDAVGVVIVVGRQ